MRERKPPKPQAAVDPKTGKPPQKQVNWNKHQRELRKRDERLAAAELQSCARNPRHGSSSVSALPS
jgi:hypothetical protein